VKENQESKKKVKCPSCGQGVGRDARWMPFCSERCRLLDLGQWLDGAFRIAGEKTNEREREES
jgi:endogenous inhibitor of DNA gyrase (YacG/DUF329 family)